MEQRDGDDDREDSPKLVKLPPKLALLQLSLWLGLLNERRIDSPPSSLLRLLYRRWRTGDVEGVDVGVVIVVIVVGLFVCFLPLVGDIQNYEREINDLLSKDKIGR